MARDLERRDMPPLSERARADRDIFAGLLTALVRDGQPLLTKAHRQRYFEEGRQVNISQPTWDHATCSNQGIIRRSLTIVAGDLFDFHDTTVAAAYGQVEGEDGLMLFGGSHTQADLAEWGLDPQDPASLNNLLGEFPGETFASDYLAFLMRVSTQRDALEFIVGDDDRANRFTTRIPLREGERDFSIVLLTLWERIISRAAPQRGTRNIGGMWQV